MKNYLRQRLDGYHQRYNVSKMCVSKIAVQCTGLQSQIRLPKISDYYDQKYGSRDND